MQVTSGAMADPRSVWALNEQGWYDRADIAAAVAKAKQTHSRIALRLTEDMAEVAAQATGNEEKRQHNINAGRKETKEAENEGAEGAATKSKSESLYTLQKG